MPRHTLIDVHSHALLPIGDAVPLPRDKMPEWSVESALALMDENGIAMSILSIPHAAQHGDARKASDIARRINEALAEIVARHPARFGALATVPGHLADATLAEITYALDTLHFDGVATSTNIQDVYLGEPVFDPWFDELNRRRATLFIHPWTLSSAPQTSLGLNYSVFEFMFDTTRMLANMVISGAKKRFADVNMISTHGGGTIPFLVERFQNLEVHFGAGQHKTVSADEVREVLASFFYDLTAVTLPSQYVGLTDLVPASQLLMGVDIPFMPVRTIGEAIRSLEAFDGFNDTDLEAIEYANAARLFRSVAAHAAK